MLTTIEGRFVKIAYASEVDISLARGLPHRPAARFNRVGEDALYLSPDELSARVAIGSYVKPDDPPRMLLTYDVERCAVVDLRHPQAADIYEQARQPWRKALAAGNDPPSWAAADVVRKSGHVGLIDPSRRRPGLWHITLMRWNEAGAPSVRQVGEPIVIDVAPDFR